MNFNIKSKASKVSNNNNSLSNNKYSFKNKYKNKKPLEEYIYYYNKEYIEGKCWFKYSKLKSNKINNNSSNNTTNYNKNSSKNNNKQDKFDKVLMIALNISKKVYKEIYNKFIYNGKFIIISIIDKKTIIKNSFLILNLGTSEYYISNKKWLINYQNIDNKFLIIVNSNKLFIKNKGDIFIIINNRKILIKNILLFYYRNNSYKFKRVY